MGGSRGQSGGGDFRSGLAAVVSHQQVSDDSYTWPRFDTPPSPSVTLADATLVWTQEPIAQCSTGLESGAAPGPTRSARKPFLCACIYCYYIICVSQIVDLQTASALPRQEAGPFIQLRVRLTRGLTWVLRNEARAHLLGFAP